MHQTVGAHCTVVHIILQEIVVNTLLKLILPTKNPIEVDRRSRRGMGACRIIQQSMIKLGNKPAAKAAGKTLPDATPPVGKIHSFSKIAVTFEPIQ